MSCRSWNKLNKPQRAFAWVCIMPVYLALFALGWSWQFIKESLSDGYDFRRDLE